MGLFGKSYANAGSGIAKNAPKKKGFARYLELFLQKFWKLIELNLFYSLFFIPLVAAIVCVILYLNGRMDFGLTRILVLAGIAGFVLLFGPATAGLMKIMRNFVTERPCFMIHEFMKTFRAEYKKALLIGFLDCFLGACIGAAFYVYPNLAEEMHQKMLYLPLAVAVSVGLVAILMNFYLFLMLVSTNLSMKNIMKNSLFLGIACMKKNVVTFLILAVVIGGIVLLEKFGSLMVAFSVLTLLPFIPGTLLALMVALNSYPQIQKYIINPYYEQRGQVNPELLSEQPAENPEDVVFQDMGGKEAPTIQKGRNKMSNDPGRQHKGKIIS